MGTTSGFELSSSCQRAATTVGSPPRAPDPLRADRVPVRPRPVGAPRPCWSWRREVDGEPEPRYLSDDRRAGHEEGFDTAQRLRALVAPELLGLQVAAADPRFER